MDVWYNLCGKMALELMCANVCDHVFNSIHVDSVHICIFKWKMKNMNKQSELNAPRHRWIGSARFFALSQSCVVFKCVAFFSFNRVRYCEVALSRMQSSLIFAENDIHYTKNCHCVLCMADLKPHCVLLYTSNCVLKCRTQKIYVVNINRIRNWSGHIC